MGEGLTHHNVLYEWAALDRLLHLPDGGPSVSYLPLAHIAERGPTIYSPLVEARAGAFCPEPTDVLAQVQHARPLAFFGVPRVWEKVWSGLIAKLDAEPPRRRRRRLADAALAAGRRRLGLHTGDVGTLDEAGYMRIIDRKKELIITVRRHHLTVSDSAASVTRGISAP